MFDSMSTYNTITIVLQTGLENFTNTLWASMILITFYDISPCVRKNITMPKMLILPRSCSNIYFSVWATKKANDKKGSNSMLFNLIGLVNSIEKIKFNLVREQPQLQFHYLFNRGE